MIAALAAVTAELGPIEKLTSQERRKRGQQGGDDERGVKYAYRGIDDVAQKAQPLLGKHGVAIVPRVGSHEVADIEVGGKPWTSHTIVVHWDIYGPGGIDDRIEATTIGEGRDNSDKGVNKATTSAYKNLLLKLFSIGDPSDDTDHEKPETSARARSERVDHAAEAVRVFESLRDLANDERVAAALKALKAANPGKDFKEKSLRDPAWRSEVERTVSDARAAQSSAVPGADEVDDIGEAMVETDAGDNDAAQFELGEALGEGLS